MNRNLPIDTSTTSKARLPHKPLATPNLICPLLTILLLIPVVVYTIIATQDDNLKLFGVVDPFLSWVKMNLLQGGPRLWALFTLYLDDHILVSKKKLQYEYVTITLHLIPNSTPYVSIHTFTHQGQVSGKKHTKANYYIRVLRESTACTLLPV